MKGNCIHWLDFQCEFIVGAFAGGVTTGGFEPSARRRAKAGCFRRSAAIALIPGMALYKPNFSVAAFASSFKQGKIIGEGVEGILLFLGISRGSILDHE